MQEPTLYQDKYRVPSTRLPGYNYGQSGMYFVTICTQNRQPYFGNVEVPNGDWNTAFLQPTDIGKHTAECWAAIPNFASFVQLNAFILMPDHLHGILLFDKDSANEDTQPVASLQVYENRFGSQSRNLASVLRGFNLAVTTYARHHEIEFQWQSRFHERIIRNQNELERIQHYIITNPSRWESEYDNGEGLYR